MTGMTRVRLGLREDLGADCDSCVGLCCVALTFVRSADFAFDKPAGEPCRHLDGDRLCTIHDRLRPSGFKGCTVYDCFGAGQKVTQQLFDGRSWRAEPGLGPQMFAAFSVVRRLHELLWYLDRALDLPGEIPHAELSRQFEHVHALAGTGETEIQAVDVDRAYDESRPWLLAASAAARAAVLPGRTPDRRLGPGNDLAGADLAGRDLRGADLRGVDLRGALLIGADLSGCDLSWTDLLGADLRDADVSGARLGDAIYLTQMQVGATRGDAATSLPEGFERPSHWPTGGSTGGSTGG